MGSPGLCAAVRGTGTWANIPVELAGCADVDRQQWTHAEDGTLRTLGMCLETPWGETAAGTGVRIGACGSPGTMMHQRWTAGERGQLVNAVSGRCLNTTGVAGTQLTIADCAGDPSMRWQAAPRPARATVGQAWNLAAPKMCARLYGGGNAPGSPVVYLECYAGDNTLWAAQDDGSYRSLGVCMDLPAGQTANGTLLRVNPCTGGAHQKWTARPDGQLQHDVSGRCLTVNPAAAHMHVMDCQALDTQKWSLPSTRTATDYTYNAADQLTSTLSDGQTTAFGYDPNGNQTAAGDTTSTFDLANRTTSIQTGPISSTFSYDGLGRRLTAGTGETVQTRYSWDRNHPLPQIAAETNGAGGLVRRYVNGIDGPVSLTTAGGATSYYHHDAYGSISDVTSSTGAAQWAYSYEPFGADRNTTQAATDAPANPIRYTGQYQDDTSGQYHLRARQYDPTSGRFTATDPLTAPIDDPYVNTYHYAANRPTVAGDPSGEVCLLFGWKRADGSCHGGGIHEDIYAAGSGPGDAVKGLFRDTRHAVTNPIQTYQGMVAACNAGFDQYNGDGLAGTAQCIDNLNPQAQWRDNYKEGMRLARAGCPREAANAFARAPVELYAAVAGAKAAPIVRTKLGALRKPAAKRAPVPKRGRSVGAAYADELPNLGNLKRMSDSRLKNKYGIDPHQLKEDMIGGEISKFEIYRHGRELYFVEKSTGQVFPAYTTLPGE